MRSTGELKKPLSWTLLALLISYLPHLLNKPIWISALLLLCMSIRWWAEQSKGPLVNAWVRTPIGLICFVAVLQTYNGLNGVAPGSALLAVMAALKVLETRTQRDQFVLLFISLFMVLAGFLVEQYLWSGPYLLISVSVIVTAWLAVGRRGKPLSDGWYLRQMRRHMLLSIPVLIAMWVLFPRVPGPFWAIPTESGKANTGLSKTMSPGDISQLSESDAVAFRATFEGIPPAKDQLYWRAIVMGRFDGRSWASDDPVHNRTRDESVTARGQEARYNVRMEATNQRWLFALDMPSDWTGRGGLYRSPVQTLQRQQPVEERIEYTVTSFLDYRADPELLPRKKRFYTHLPEGSNPRARAFAEQLRKTYPDQRDYAQAVLNYFTEQPYYYTLSPPALGREAVDEFLFDTQRGFCEHYASSYAFLMRAGGIPARIVAGYQGGESNPFADYLIVRQSDAHAWTEIWLPQRGWVRVDPTAAVAPQRIEQNLDSALRELGERSDSLFELAMLERMKLAWDMVNARWNEWVLGYGPETQRELLEKLGLQDVGWQDMIIMLAIVLVGIMTVVTGYLWIAHQPPRPDYYQALFRRAQRRTGILAHRGETATGWAHRVGREQPENSLAARRFARHYLRARYAGNTTARRRLPLTLFGIRGRWRSRFRRIAHSNQK